MSKVIPRSPAVLLAPAVSSGGGLPVPPVPDTLGRPLRDLRISVTDRCNFRCSYCMPREVFDSDYQFLPHGALLSFEEIARVAKVAVRLGVRKLRLTGGEPLLRKNLEVLVAMLAQLRTPEGEPVELTLTTNGTLLRRKARALKEAGLHRVTVSLDALDQSLFARMSDSDIKVSDVLDGINAAAEAGLAPVKVNMVVRKGTNDHQIIPMARHFRHSGHILRFIEFMDVGTTNGWNMREVLTGAQLLEHIAAQFSLEPVKADYRGEVAERWRYLDGAGEIGVITSVSHPFCGDCTRARLSPEGRLFLCLFASQGYDLRSLVRGSNDDELLAAHMAGVWSARVDRYSELRGQAGVSLPKIEMSYIGG